MPDNETELSASFRRSSFCGSSNCVEVAAPSFNQVFVRDAKDLRPNAPVLRFTTVEWNAFLAGVLAGEFSHDALTRRH
jgi:Domain of unknown function (DUF397)